jgi:lysophospholipase L1-like esterase
MGILQGAFFSSFATINEDKQVQKKEKGNKGLMKAAECIGDICEEIRKRSPANRIVVMAIFPRNAQPDNGLRKLIAETNGLLNQRFAKDPSITYLDIGNEFLASDGTLPRAMMPDGTHPSDAGYHIWADTLIEAGVGR